jgi:hypothetical protein
VGDSADLNVFVFLLLLILHVKFSILFYERVKFSVTDSCSIGQLGRVWGGSALIDRRFMARHDNLYLFHGSRSLDTVRRATLL